jgi:hypothetical protein
MLKKTFLFITTILTATSVSTGYSWTESLNGTVSAATFLDWFNNAEKYAHINGLIVLDLVPAVFLIIQAALFFKDSEKLKGFFTILALLANLYGALLLIQFAWPIASKIAEWTPDTIPSDWIGLKNNWLKYIGQSALMGVIGWLFFVITYFVPAKKNIGLKQLSPFLNFTKNALAFMLTFILVMGAPRLYDFFFFPVLYKISGTTFIEMHRPLDLAIRTVGPIVFIVILSLLLLLATLFFLEKSKNKGFLIIAAILFLLADTFIALQYNRPINDLFLTWTPTTIPSNWASIRDEWLSYHFYRDIFITLQLTSVLLIHFVSQKKSLMPLV